MTNNNYKFYVTGGVKWILQIILNNSLRKLQS